MSERSLFAHRDFRLLLAGQTTSQLGTQISGVAIPLLAVVTLQATPLELGIVNAASTLAFAVIGLPAGAWLDHWRRRRTLVLSDLGRLLLLATIPLAALTGWLTIGQLVVVSLLVGCARVFFDVGYQSYLPMLIGRDRVLAGNSGMEAIRAGGQVVGPGVGGILVAAIGAANVVLMQAIAFGASAVSLLAIRKREPVVATPANRPRMLPQIAEGLSFVIRNPILRATALASAVSNFAFAIASAVTVIFLVDSIGLSAVGVGLVFAAGSVTVAAGAAFTPALSRAVGSARIIWLSLAVTGPVGLLIVFAQPGWGVILVVVGLAAGELGQIVYSVTNLSLRQRLTPERMLSRVTATMRFLIMGALPVGALLGGAIGTVLGVRGALAVSCSLIVLAPIPVYLALRRFRDVEEVPDWHVDTTLDSA